MSKIIHNWEHTLVGEEYTYSFQAGSDLVRITDRKNKKIDILLSSEELCDLTDFIRNELGKLP